MTNLALRPITKIEIFSISFEPSSVALRIVDTDGKVEHFAMKLSDLKMLGLQLLTDGIVLEKVPRAVALLVQLPENTVN